MLLLKLPSFIQVACLCIGCLGGYWIYWELTTGQRHRQLIKKHGCRPIARAKTSDPILGLDILFKVYRWSQQHIFLEKLTEILFGSGNKTVELNFFRIISIFTTEAENVKTVLSLNHKAFKLGDKTKELDLLLGDGIFTNEGQAWHQSRELLRPSFARSQIADLDMLEKHVNKLTDKIPRDGSTIDLSESFSQHTLSIAIEFVFGDSTSGSHSDAQTTSSEAFARDWNRVSNYLGSYGYHGKFWLWHFILDRVRLNPGLIRDCRQLHGKHEAISPEVPSIRYVERLGTLLTHP